MTLFEMLSMLFQSPEIAAFVAVAVPIVVQLLVGFGIGELLRRMTDGSVDVRTFHTLKHLIDLIPPPKLRKRLQKLLADQAHHVSSLRKAGRYRSAIWIEVTTWILVGWYVVLAPVSAVWGAAKDRIG